MRGKDSKHASLWRSSHGHTKQLSHCDQLSENGEDKDGVTAQGPSSSTPAKRGIVPYKDLSYWERLVQTEFDEERWDGPDSIWLVWYRRHFRDEWLFPPSVTNLENAQEGLVLFVTHRQAAQVFREEFLVWRVIRDRTSDRLFEVGQHLKVNSVRVHGVNLNGCVMCLIGATLWLAGFILLPPVQFKFVTGRFFEALVPFLIITGVATTVLGTTISIGAAIADSFLSASQKPRMKAIMDEDTHAMQHFTGVLQRLGVTSDRLSTWAQQHPQAVSWRKNRVVDDVLVIYDMLAARSQVVTAAVFSGGDQVFNLVGNVARKADNEPTSKVGIVLNVLATTGDIIVNVFKHLLYRVRNAPKSRSAIEIGHKVPLLEREKRYLGQVYHRCEKFI